MGQVREVDAITDAIIETEREIAGEAWGNEDTERADASGDRTLESVGGGLEGQHEAATDEDENAEGSEETEGDEESEEEAEDGEGEADTDAAATGETKPEAKPEQRGEQQAGRVPSGKLREANERARLAEAAAETERNARAEDRKALDALQAQLTTLTQIVGQRQAPQATQQQTQQEQQPPEVPDIFENPRGFVDHITSLVQQAVAPVRQDVRKSQVETSFALAHVAYKDGFTKAFEAVNGLNPQNPDDRATVQRIYNSSNPGEELVRWHKRSEALARFGDDPDAAEARIREQTRETLLKDPEFRKQLLADLRAEASTGENGAPRTTIRLPKSGERARAGSNVGADRMDHSAQDNSEQSVADAAWR